MQRGLQKKIMRLAILKCGTQEQLAEKVGTTQIQVSRYNTGKRDMPLSFFLKILRLLGGKIELRNR